MKYLLDTHIFLWWILKSPKLPTQAEDVIADVDNSLFLSAASTWEMVIKTSLGKLTLPATPEEFIREQLRINSIQFLQVSLDHTFAVAELPLIHKDPFDRMLIAQARHEHMTLVTNDPWFERYDVDIL